MVLDTSAIVAAITNEPDGARLQEAILGAASLVISSVTVLETRIVLQSRHGAEAVREFDEMLKNAGVVIVPFDAEMAETAFQAFRRYGKGQGHPAQLNIIDCAAYALAKSRARPCCSRVAISREPMSSRRSRDAVDGLSPAARHSAPVISHQGDARWTFDAST
ncbi:MAG TPA: type II toxin-antitoxin system VapC family toxin [Stellaceae bacterium]|nr:type II toxin-antitoxin system VapC family toxin [Stellaceae bacterium]